MHHKKRCRHEKVKLNELIKKSEENYVDFQAAACLYRVEESWVDI